MCASARARACILPRLDLAVGKGNMGFFGVVSVIFERLLCGMGGEYG